jgi:hypothetical protein
MLGVFLCNGYINLKQHIMKKLITLIFLCAISFSYAQYPDTTYEDKEEREHAKKIVAAYDKELGLDGAQYPIFLDKVEDYIVLRKKAKATLKGQEELDALTELMVKETLEMQDLLTRPQYILYKKIRQEIQPIKIVNPN